MMESGVTTIKVQAPQDMGDCSLMVVYKRQKYSLWCRVQKQSSQPQDQQKGYQEGPFLTAVG
jgi:hypothetical protein